MDFVEETGTAVAAGPRAVWMARASVLSLNWVPVPWELG
jgi:hypothetical protein